MDLPGNQDNSALRELVNYYYIKRTFEHVEKVSMVIVLKVNERGSLSDNDIYMLHSFMNMFGKYHKNVTFIVNQIENMNNEKIELIKM
jgi:hypothetical protein